ncbi:hypothetical protein Tco_0806371 [Tanacetum coccineum]
MEEINNLQQEPDESLFRAWERFKELPGMKVSLNIICPCRKYLVLQWARVPIEETAEYSQIWEHGTFLGPKSTETLTGLAAIQALHSTILDENRESFTIIDDDDMTKDIVLGMKFCKKYASCQRIMKRFTLGNNCERIMKDE